MPILQGGCRCASVRYRIETPAMPRSYACHCLDCQTWSGSAFSQQFLVPEGQFTVEGETQLFELAGQSGRVSMQRFCPQCGTRVYNTNTARVGVIIVRAGTLDRSHELDCVAHLWTSRKQAWLQLESDVPSWPENAEPDVLAAALRAP